MTLNNTRVVLFKRKQSVCISEIATTRVRAMEGVRELRERLDMTQAALAERCGCHWTTVSQIERARMLPSLELFARLASVLKVSPSRLLKLLITGYRHKPSSIVDLQTERENRKVDH